MKIRTNYVSNSSSSSFLVAQDVSDFTPCIKLSEEIWKAIEANFIGYDDEKINLSEINTFITFLFILHKNKTCNITGLI